MLSVAIFFPKPVVQLLVHIPLIVQSQRLEKCGVFSAVCSDGNYVFEKHSRYGLIDVLPVLIIVR